MKTIDELQKGIEDKLEDRAGFYSDFQVTLERMDEDDDYCASLKVSQMYNHLELTFDDLLFISDLFKTTNIKQSQYSHGGCETCDYGSEYGTEFEIHDIGIKIDWRGK